MKKIFFFFFFLLSASVFPQIEGKSAFSFINIETSPRVEAMGGNIIAIFDNDLSLVQTTPSLLNPLMNNELVFSFTDYFDELEDLYD